MIRTNKQGKHKQNMINITKIQTYNYRNAVYQGEVSKQKRLRQGKGVIYVTDSRHFIVCNQFKDNKLSSYCLFFHTHTRYHYGYWNQNQPEGIAIFRMNEVLIIAEYLQGMLSPNSKILLVFEKYSTGIIVQAIQEGSWQIIQRSDILCNEHLEQLISECNFKTEPIPYLLIKYLNDYMVADKSFLKLRLLNNMYYRFGFDEGLAIIFDDSYRLYSVGVHNKNNLASFGVRYNKENLGNKVEEGIFDGRNTFVFDEPNKPIYKIGQLYCKRHLAEVNFQNQIYKDPSESYFQYFQDLLSSSLIKNLIGNVLESPTKTKAFYTIMNEQPVKDESLKRYEKLQFPEFEMATFKRPQKQNLQIPGKRQESIKDIQTSNILWENSHRSIETFQFEKLSEKNRLDILKKQLYVNLSHKSSQREKEDYQRAKKPRIITMSPVDVKNVVRSRRREEIIAEKGKTNEPYIYELPTNWRDISGPNLQKHIDIRINDYVEDRGSRSRSISKTKKKIFEQCPNVIKDYSPRQSASPSPFKSRMRSKIFNHTPDRTSKSRSRSSTRIFPQKKTPEKIDFTKINPISINQPQSPHMMYDASIEKSESQSHIKAYPITMTRQTHIKEKVSESQNLLKQKEEKKEEYRKEQRVRVDDYLALQTPNRKKDLREQFARKKNEVYRNTMKNQYGDYVFEPISLKATGNLPYVESTHTLTSNKSCKTIEKSPSKKGILETSPLKRQKMSSYMNNSPFEFRQSERLADFKRRVNYF